MKMFKDRLLFIPIVFLLCTVIPSCTKVSQKVDNTSLDEKTVANPKYFYYYKGQKRVLTLNTELINIVSKKIIVSEKFVNFGTVRTNEKIVKIQTVKEQKASASPSSPPQTLRHSGQLKLSKKITEPEYLVMLDMLRADDPNSQFYPTFIDPVGNPVGISSYFNVKLYSGNDYLMLAQVASNYGAVIVEQNELMPEWYTLSCSGSQDALTMAAQFYETGLFANTEPDLNIAFALSCPTDQYFSSQWGAYNNLQYGGTAGVDIKLCGALNMMRPTGAVINVAVVDRGFEVSHEDLSEGAFPAPSYDILSGGQSISYDPHGTAVAGILGAHENGIGITGVAPWCKLMSISHPMQGYTNPTTSMQLAKGIQWAWKNGADVISCSWIAVEVPSLNEAIGKALANGRGGKGCVVVFGAGNGGVYSNVEYPGNSYPSILAVGAVTPCGLRKNGTICGGSGDWFSSYGPELDIMAPGSQVTTLDNMGSSGHTSDNIWPDFDGTSAACPHVAGVAALILAKNPDLRNWEVNNIIESTAQKVGPYSYATTPGRPNGTWHQEMGYGLVNAAAAVAATPAAPIVYGTSRIYYANILNGN